MERSSKLPAQAFLGRGLGFPPTFEQPAPETPDQLGQVRMVAAQEDIIQSLEILLSTRPGERPLEPEYGCNLSELLFEPLTTTLVAYIEDLIASAILLFEPRITTERIQINEEQYQEGLIRIEIEYVIKSTNSRFNFVYPFYIQEGTEIPLNS